jgi:septal ring factor EnvC (AmiA/AmiB activator)
MAAPGSDEASVKADASESRVSLTIDGTTYTRRLSRRKDAVVATGDPYVEDATLADLFAFLLETNEARQAVARNDDLRDVIMRPVDTSEIERQVNRYRSQREEIDDQIAEIDRLSQELPELEEERSASSGDIGERRSELADVEDRLGAIDGNVDERRGERERN